MSTWIAIIAVGAISFALRAVPLAVLGRVSISDGTDRMLRHAGTAAQTALLVGAVQHGAGSGSSVAAIAATTVSLVVANAPRLDAARRRHGRARLRRRDGGGVAGQLNPASPQIRSRHGCAPTSSRSPWGCSPRPGDGTGPPPAFEEPRT